MGQPGSKRSPGCESGQHSVWHACSKRFASVGREGAEVGLPRACKGARLLGKHAGVVHGREDGQVVLQPDLRMQEVE